MFKVGLLCFSLCLLSCHCALPKRAQYLVCTFSSGACINWKDLPGAFSSPVQAFPRKRCSNSFIFLAAFCCNVHVLHPLFHWYHGRANLQLPTALLCLAMCPTKPGTPVDLSWFELILYTAPVKSLMPGPVTPRCSLGALLLAGCWNVGPACQFLPWYSKGTSSPLGATILWGFLQLCLRRVLRAEDIIKPSFGLSPPTFTTSYKVWLFFFFSARMEGCS